MTTMVPGPRPSAAPAKSGEGPALPAQGEPGWTLWSRRVWPLDLAAAAPPRTVALVAAAAVVGGAVWHPTVLGIGYLLIGALVFAVLFATARRRPEPMEWLGIGTTLALLAVPGVLAAGWLGWLCVLAGWILGWCTVVGGRTWTAVLLGPVMPAAAYERLGGWLRRSPLRRGAGVDTRVLTRVALVAAVTLALVVVFGGLFAGADPAFARLAGSLVPTVDGIGVIGRILVCATVAALVLAGSYLLTHRPRLDRLAPEPDPPLRSWEWAVPLAVLDVLFVAFVAVQATVLFGGHTHVLETAGLTYAEYARQGFWQLLGVSALTLIVIAVVLRRAGRTGALDRRLIRVLVGTLCATSIVIVVSAIHRMWVYQQAYGFSVDRLLVITVELWLGVVFVLVAACGARMAADWLPRAVLLAGALALLGLAVLNPERLIAEANIDRFEQTGRLDAGYLATLSPDADAALLRLPEQARRCVARPPQPARSWTEFNLSRSQALPAAGAAVSGCSPYTGVSRTG